MKLAIYLILGSAVASDVNKDWIDPHDMGLGQAKPSQTRMKSDPIQQKETNRSTTVCPAELFLSRHIARLNYVLKNHEDVGELNGILEIKLNHHEASILRNFALLNNPNKAATPSLKLKALHGLEPVLEKLVAQAKVQPSNHRDYYLEVIVPLATLWLENLFFVAPMIIAFSTIYCLWRGTPVWLIVFSFILISFAWEWSHMVKRVIAKRQEIFFRDGGQAPEHCKHESMLHKFLTGFVGLSSAKECVKYQEALHVDAYLEVTPLMAAMECVSKFVLHPLDLLGEKLGLFFSGVLSSNSYMASFGVLLLSFCILALLFIILSGYSIKLPMISIEPSKLQQVPEDTKFVTVEELQELKELILSLKNVEVENSRIRQIDNLQSAKIDAIEDKVDEDDDKPKEDLVIKEISSVSTFEK